ncbi:MAG: hypothetical protein KF805_16580 [Phycisphaeraceae bacterium]|nr:hypothetical protein [Phycisphaeraceae bacterium]
MKNILPWLKKNWLVPSLCVFMVAVLAGTWWYSSAWNAQIRDEQQKAAGDLLTKINNMKVTYALPVVAGDAKAVEVSSPPNAVLTTKFAERKKQLLDQREGVVKIAEAFNKGDKKPLIDGLFPAPAAGQEQLKQLEFVQKLVGNATQGTQSAYQGLLDSVRAGGPVGSTQLTEQINDIARRETEKLRGTDGKRELTAAEKETISKLLLDARRSEYVRRANEISVYADMSAFPSSNAGPGGNPGMGNNLGAGSNQILLSAPATPPNIRQAFLWQADFWLLQDVFAIIRAANTGPGGKLTSERDSVVKRIEKIEILPWKVQTASEGIGTGIDPGASQAVGGEFKDSISGHSDGASTDYDVRRARLTLIVSSARLPELFNSIGRSNFAFIVGFAMEKVDGWQDLSNGYYYGDESVVRVLLDIEFTWLRSWTEPLFPLPVRKGLGLPDPAPPGESGEHHDDGPK